MKTEFCETHSGNCLPRMGMARQSPAADKPGGQLKSVPDANQPPRPHQAAGRNQGRVPLVRPWGRLLHSCSLQRMSLIWGFPLAAGFSVL